MENNEFEIEVAGDHSPVEAWIEGARGGAREPLGHALEEFRKELAELAAHELGSELRPKGGVSDLVQETFHKAVRDFPKFAGRTGPEWKAWLRAIFLHNLTHLARSYRTTRKRNLKGEISLDRLKGADGGEPNLVNKLSSPSAVAMKNELMEAIERAMGRLKERDRLLLSMRFREQFTLEEMGRRLGCSTPAAQKALGKAVERLRAEVGNSSLAGAMTCGPNRDA